jgi:hypothetical protein
MSAIVVDSGVDAAVRAARRRIEERRERQGDDDCFRGIMVALGFVVVAREIGPRFKAQGGT